MSVLPTRPNSGLLPATSDYTPRTTLDKRGVAVRPIFNPDCCLWQFSAFQADAGRIARSPAHPCNVKRAAPFGTALSMSCVPCGLTLRELEAPARLAATVFLTLDNTAVTGQEPCGLERAAQTGIIKLKRLRDTVLHCTGL